MATQKYFIAIVITGPLFDRAEAAKQELYEKYGLRGALRSPAHITLHRPFEWKVEKEHELIQKLETFCPHLAPHLVLDGFGAFAPRVIYVNVAPNTQLVELHNRLKIFARQILRLFNESDDLRGFHPHITVASRDLKKARFAELWPQFEKRPFGGEFTCGEISLLRLNGTWQVIRRFDILGDSGNDATGRQ